MRPYSSLISREVGGGSTISISIELITLDRHGFLSLIGQKPYRGVEEQFLFHLDAWHSVFAMIVHQSLLVSGCVNCCVTLQS